MISAWLRPSLVTLLCSLPAVAWAGGTGTGTGTDTDVGTTTDVATGTGTGTDTGTGTGTGTDTGSDTGDGDGSSTGQECVECMEDPDPVQIVTPADGATVGTTIEVRVTAPHTCVCDGCACAPRPPLNVNVRVDNMTVAGCQLGDEECNTEDNFFTIDLEPGPHTIDAVAEHNGQPSFSEPIEVTVMGSVGDDTTGSPPPPPPPPPATTDDGGSDSTGAPAADGGSGGGGCGCRTDGERSGAPLLFALAALLGLGARRRR